MRIRIVIFILFWTLCVQGHAYEVIKPVAEGQLPEVPSISHLKEVSMPSASLATGAVEFEVPIYTLKAEDISLPLTLRYRSNGIKLGDDSYPVGLGWSLNLGFRITRTIRGRADEKFPFFNGNFKKPTYEELLSSVARYDTYSEQSVHHTINHIDSENDIFYVFLPETMLTLMYVNGQFIGVNCEEYKISSDSDLSEITVVNPLGHVYRFKNIGQQIEIDNKNHNIEWLLSKIELPSGNSVEFTWEFYAHLNPTITRYYNHFIYGYWNHDTSTDDNGTMLSREYKSILHRNLTAIKYLDTKIVFEYNFNNTLEDISVYWDTIKKHSIFLSYKFVQSNSNCKLVFLSEIEHSSDGKYSFEYYPDYSSYETDRWGYCNGRDESEHHLPAIEFRTALTKRKDYRIGGKDFDISETHMKSNLLREVRYPTGGRAVWDYEIHQFEPIEETAEFSSYIGADRLEKGGGLRVRSISLYKSATDTQPRVRRYAYSVGKCIAAPLLSTFLSTYMNEIVYKFTPLHQESIYLLRKNVVEIKNTSDYLEYQEGALPIWYEEVTEYENVGKTVYKFKNYVPENRIRRKFGRTLPDSIFSIFSSGPQLIEKSTYRNASINEGLRDSSTIIPRVIELDYRKESSEYYEYDTTVLAPIANLAIKRNLVQTQMTTYAPDFCLNDIFYFDVNLNQLTEKAPPVNTNVVPPGIAYEYIINKSLIYDYSAYVVVPMRERLKSKRIVDYANGELATVEEYSYVPGTGLIDKITTSRDGEGGTLALGYVPAGEIGQTMRERNMVGVVTSSIASFDGCTSKAEFAMNVWNGKIVKPENLTLSRGSTSYLVQSYNYDSHGNIREIKRPDGFCTSYLWGYKGFYPVYKFSGMSFEEIKQIFGSRTDGTEAQNLNLDLSLADCPAEYAEYSPLVGMSAYRDAAGVTTRYKYDAAGRLAETSIDGHGVVATYDYNIGGEKPNYAAENIWLDSRSSNRNRSVETFDGLGRSISRVNAYPQGLLAEYTVYDAMGRPVKAWLPAPVDSEHPSLADIETSAPEAYSDSDPYTVSTYESSPTGRLLSTIRPGHDLHSGKKKISYSRNVNNGTRFRTPRYKATASGIEYLGGYPGLSLLMEETKDEDGLIVQTFTDFRGLKVAEKRGSTGSMLCTRYVYDGYGDLRYVLPPKLADGTYARSDAAMQELSYWYDYDARGNVTVRKLPGRAAILYRYDSAGRLVAVQDGNTAPRWQLSFYDKFGRVAVEAEAAWSDSELAAFLAAPCGVSWTGSGALGGYEPERTLPRAVDAVHVVRRYDRAGRVVEETAGQSVRRQSYNRLGQLDTVRVSYGDRGVVYSYRYDYRGKLTEEKIVPEGFSAPALMTSRFYDNSDRPTTTFVRRSFTGIFEDFILSDSPNDTLAGMRREYDRAGHLVRFRRGVRGNTYYSYDTPGYLAAIRNEILLVPVNFGPDFPLKPFRTSRISAFDSIVPFPDPFEVGPLRNGGTYIFGDTLLRSDGAVPLYNGRISSRKTRDGRYDYGYDGNGRLASAVFSDSGGADYSTEYGYDSNGNLTSMVRAGVVDRAGTGKIYGALDMLDVSLEGNRAVRYDIESDGDVFEGRTGFGGRNDSYDIEYDANGNVVFDGSVACAYVYNRLNQPVSIETEDGTMTLDYDGAGTLLSRTVESGGVTTKTEYLGPYELVDGELRAAYFDGGYFDADGNVHYYIPDYQGNIVADVTAAGKVVQKASYYPYGEPWLEPEGDNRRLYGGKERLNFGAFHHSDYGPRLLDSRSGRWNSQDAYGEKYRHLSPYSLCGGDPINNIDPSGNIIQTIINGAAYQYINGSNGWGFYNNDEQYTGSDAFANALIEALATLQSGVVGSTLVESLVDSEKTVHIKEGKENGWIADDMTIHFNPFGVTYDVVVNQFCFTTNACDPFISLSHEMFHAESHLFGYKYKEWGRINGEPYCTDEWWAVYGENFIRHEHDREIRHGYGITNGYADIYPYRTKQIIFPFFEANRITFSNSKWAVYLLNYRKRHR